MESEGGKGAATLRKVAEWNKKMLYLNGELKRYHEYLEILGKRREPEKASSELLPSPQGVLGPGLGAEQKKVDPEQTQDEIFVQI